MIILDTSGLLAALFASQRGHARARRALEAASGPLVVSPFVLAEVDYLIGRWEGVRAELALLDEVLRGAYELATFSADELEEARRVIADYPDLRVGLADASLVVLAGRYRTTSVLTLDERHFRVLRTPQGAPFRILPADA